MSKVQKTKMEKNTKENSHKKGKRENLYCEMLEFEKTHPMNEEEREALHKWVDGGHSVYENEVYGDYYPVDFLTAYRDYWKRSPLERKEFINDLLVYEFNLSRMYMQLEYTLMKEEDEYCYDED